MNNKEDNAAVSDAPSADNKEKMLDGTQQQGGESKF